ncbi:MULTISPECIES: hypothetical protein [unclassified Streptomyces]|uniref:hypothetical protein n=1 Tax=unclassified Streptomyces TaxID=2593676 RepID=UPI0035DFE88A
MLVDLEFHHPDAVATDFEVGRDLDALPRVGDEVLWTEVTEVEQSRVYEVTSVAWSMGSDTTGASVRITCTYRGEG